MASNRNDMLVDVMMNQFSFRKLEEATFDVKLVPSHSLEESILGYKDMNERMEFAFRTKQLIQQNDGLRS